MASKVTCDSDKAQVYWRDSEISGLSLRVSSSGKRDWHYGSGANRRKLGDWCATGERGLSYAMAVAKANPLSLAKAEGKDWQATLVNKGKATSLNELVEWFLQEKHPEKKTNARGELVPNSTHRNIRSMLRPILKDYGDTPPEEITRDVVMETCRKYLLPHSKQSARKLVGWMRTLRNWAVRNERVVSMAEYGHMIEDNRELRHRPTAYKFGFTDDQIVRLFGSIEKLIAYWHENPHRRARNHSGERPNRHAIGYLVLMALMFTGARKEEISGLRKDEIKGDWIVLRDHKTVEHVGERKIYLGAEAKSVVYRALAMHKTMNYKGDLVFPGPLHHVSHMQGMVTNPGDYLQTALDEAGIEERVVVHSLRSLWINYAIRVGLPLDLVRQNVGHTDERVTMRHYITQAEGELVEGLDKVHTRFAKMREQMGWQAQAAPEVISLNVMKAKKELEANPERKPVFVTDEGEAA
jgi:integrase